jgi:hypothetical protein
MFAAFRPTARSFILGALASTMILSLIYSTSVQYGHADVPVAQTAAEIQPLQAGDRAPRFTVETVDNRPFDFDPRKLERPAVLISFRGGWCPYCNMHLSELRHAISAISKMDVDVLFLSGDRSEILLSSLKCAGCHRAGNSVQGIGSHNDGSARKGRRHRRVFHGTARGIAGAGRVCGQW